MLATVTLQFYATRSENVTAAKHSHTHTHTHTRLMALFPGLPRWASTRKAKPIWILLKQETVSGSGITWAICKSAPCSRQITMPAPHHSVFYKLVPFLPPNQQRQCTEGKIFALWFNKWLMLLVTILPIDKTRFNPSHYRVKTYQTMEHSE